MIRVHELKCWPEYYGKIVKGTKRFEFRKNDRNFQTGDILCLREWRPETCSYTGNEQYVSIDYIMHYIPSHVVLSQIPKDYCIMSITSVKISITRIQP